MQEELQNTKDVFLWLSLATVPRLISPSCKERNNLEVFLRRILVTRDYLSSCNMTDMFVLQLISDSTNLSGFFPLSVPNSRYCADFRCYLINFTRIQGKMII